MDAEKLYSVPEAAKFLGGISKWTIHAWLSQGKLQRTKIGSRTMIRESELQRVIEDGERSPSRMSSQSSRGGTTRKANDESRGLNVSTDAARNEEPC